MTRAEQTVRQAADRGMRGPSARGEYKTCCPFCEAATGKVDLKFKLQLNPGKGVYYCYKCGVGGRIDLSWLGAVEAKAEKPIDASLLGPPEGFVPFSENKNSRAMQPYRDYMHRRAQHSDVFAFTGACPSGRYAGRVIVPHLLNLSQEPIGAQSKFEGIDRAYRWAGFAARTVYDGVEPKYLYPPGMNRRDHLWGGFLPSIRKDDPLFLVEGVFDAIALYPYAVASFGKEVTDPQLDLLVKWGVLGQKVVVCLDGDAWEDCVSVAMRLALRDVSSVRWCRLPPKTDPGMLGMKCAEYIQEL